MPGGIPAAKHCTNCQELSSKLHQDLEIIYQSISEKQCPWQIFALLFRRASQRCGNTMIQITYMNLATDGTAL